MDIKKRLFRRPFATVLWSALVISMTVLIGVGCVLNYSTQRLIPMLSDIHTSVALRTDRESEVIVTDQGASWSLSSKMFDQDDLDFFLGLDSVENVYFHSLTGAYIPELTSALGLSGMHGNYSDSYAKANESYDQIIFVGTVLRILEVSETLTGDLRPIGYGAEEPHQTVTAEIRIQQIVSAHPDYLFADDGLYNSRVNCTFNLYGEEALEYLEEGGTYLFSGEYDPTVVKKLDYPEGTAHPSMMTAVYNVMKNGTLYGYQYGVTYPEMKAVNLMVHPAASKLTGSVESFLEDPANADWVSYIAMCSDALHSLPVMGTESIKCIYPFLSGDAYIVDGRLFSEEEYAQGDRVCLISQTVAMHSGIGVGDTVHLSQFPVNEIYNFSIRSNSVMLSNPTVGEPMADREFETENEEFTVIGIYRQSDEWRQTSYSFTPNTVFVPRKAQISGGFGDLSIPKEKTLTLDNGSSITSMILEERGAYGVFFAIQLRNGASEDFLLAVSGTPWENQFHVFDMGYESVLKSLAGISESAENLLLIAVAGWLILLAMYVLLYQNGQRRNLGIMRSLGSKPVQVRSYLFGSGFALAAVSVLIGTAATAFFIGRINGKLLDAIIAESDLGMHSAGIEMDTALLSRMIGESQLPVYMLIGLALIQTAAIALTLWFHASRTAKSTPKKLLGV